MLKKLLTIGMILLLFLNLSAFAVSDKHWAENEINLMVSKGVLSDRSNVRPDDLVLRSEFIKMVNRTFEFSKAAQDSFIDVHTNDWFYNDFLIAKESGYIKGNESGQAAPNDYLTRAEASVILFRLLKLQESDQNQSFQDQNEIPAWAVKEVNALVDKGYLKGYPDQTFRAQKNISRAEAIYILASILKEKKDQPANPVQPEELTNSPAAAVRPSSGGGTGGGSSAEKNVEIATPVISKYVEDQETIEWFAVANAKKYEIKVVAEDIEENITVQSNKKTQYSVPLTSVFNIISGNFDDSQVNFSITVKAYGNPGYEDSKESKVLTVEKIYMPLDSPVLSIRSGLENSIPRAIVYWDEILGAKSYEVSVKVDGNNVEASQFTYLKEKNEILFQDLTLLEDKTCAVFVKAISKDKAVKKNSLVSALEFKNEYAQELNYEKIYTAQDFEKIRSAPNGNFILMRNIDLGEFTPIPEFSGTLNTYNNVPLTIKVNIKQSGVSDVGIFKTISGTAKISNLKIEGTLTGGSQVGSIAGNMTGNSEIQNCMNFANITGVSNVGGLVGKSYTEKTYSVINSSKNFGIVSGGGNNIGGIIGYATGTKISSCGNQASITAGGRNVGGISGAFYTGNIIKTYNIGEVKGASNSGGIVGTLGGTTAMLFTNCYNQGTITAGTNAGGIVANAIAQATLDYCYNTGNITLATGYPISSPQGTVTNSFYSNKDSDDGIEGTTFVSEGDLKNFQSEVAAKLLLNGFEFLDNNEYPSVSHNPQIDISNLLSYDYVRDLTASYQEESRQLTLSWQNPDVLNVKKILIIVKNNTTILEVANDELGKMEESYTVQNIDKGDYYEFKVTLVYYDGTELEANLEGLAE